MDMEPTEEPIYTITPKLTAAMDQITAMVLNGKGEQAAQYFAETVGSDDLSKQLEFVAILSAIGCGHQTPSEISLFVHGYLECHTHVLAARMAGLGPLA